MGNTERSAAVIHTVPDDASSESRTGETVVSLWNRFRPPAPNGLSRTLPVFKIREALQSSWRLRGTEIRPTLCEVV